MRGFLWSCRNQPEFSFHSSAKSARIRCVNTETQRGQLFVIAAPSGAGKTTLVHELMQANNSLRFSISYTTREKRHTETPGEAYFFVDKADFQTMIEQDDFLEHALVFDNHYGTSKSQVEELLEQGHNVILEIDWQGAQQIRQQMPECSSIFILPPSVAELKRRLTGRGTDSEAVIERRFRDALADMSHWQEFDYAVINDDLQQAATELSGIVNGKGSENAVSSKTMTAKVAALLTDTTP
jgi:guanylate kinase